MDRLIRLVEGAPVERVQAQLQGLGLWTQPLVDGAGRVVAFVELPHSMRRSCDELRAIAGVAEVLTAPSSSPHLAAAAGAAVELGPRLRIGPGAPPVLLAGPCCVESEEQVQAAAEAVARAGGRLLRGGAWKPRTSPYAFRGHGPDGLRWLRQAADAHGLGVVTEVLSEVDVELVAEQADLVQVGSRNMQNFALLRAVGRTGRPVLLKRGRAATLSEWRAAAEHLLVAGAAGVVLCERGIAGIDPETRNVLDLGAVALLTQTEGLAVVVDPSHAAGRRDLLPALSAAALAAGASGLILECHPDPERARSDGPQALPLEELLQLSARLGFVPRQPPSALEDGRSLLPEQLGRSLPLHPSAPSPSPPLPAPSAAPCAVSS
jgi:3-deoxy-7-phosphoheptulonate synthase